MTIRPSHDFSRDVLTVIDDHTVAVNRVNFRFGPIKVRLIKFLISRPGELCTFIELIKAGWPHIKEPTKEQQLKTLREHLSKIRMTLGLTRFAIHESRFHGYKYDPDRFCKDLGIPIRDASDSGHYSEEEIINKGFETISTALQTIFKKLQSATGDALKPYWTEDLSEHVRQINMDVHSIAVTTLAKCPDIQIIGEGDSFQKRDTSRLFAILNALDGTELMAHRLGNWCSTLVIFQQDPNPKIHAAFVGMANRQIFFMKASEQKAFFRSSTDSDDIDHEILLHDSKTALKDATICFYGQRPNRLLEVSLNGGFRRLLRAGCGGKKKKVPPQMRIFNLGGNPMIMRLVSGDIDAIIELVGQEPRDVVPAAIIALKAGAVLYDLKKKQRIAEKDLCAYLSTPKEDIRYLVASSDKLARALLRELGFQSAIRRTKRNTN
jgi:fructose-1,6-bisphosphatase/inositol monophosphatase family enzyme